MKKFFAILLAVVLSATVFCAALLTPLNASAAGANIAQGKRITGADPTNGNQYTDRYNASLLDGLASDEFDPDGAPGDWFSYYYNSNQAYPSNAESTDSGILGEFTVDLAGTASVESVRLHMIATKTYTAKGIQPPYRIVVEYSSDNASWNAFGERMGFDDCKDIDWIEIEADSAVQAQYIKFSIYYSGPTLLLNEVEVIGEMGTSGATAAIPADVRYEIFNLTPLDADKDWYQDGIVVAIPNDSDEELTVASGEYALRYMFILVFDREGVCTQVGNNLLSADDERAAEFPQHDFKVPAGGFAVVFYYNANEGPSNQALFDYYNDLGGSAYSNETAPASAGKNYTAEIEANTVTIYFATVTNTPDTPSDETPSEDPADTPSDVPDEASSASEPEETSEPSEPADSASEADSTPENTAPSASDTTSVQDEDGGSNVGVIVGIIAGVVAIAAIVVVVVKRKK